MLIHPRLSADDAPSDDIRERIAALLEQVKADPKNQVPLLHLAKAYGDVWVRNNDPNVMLRALQCIERTIELEKGEHAAHIRQLLTGLAKNAQAKGQTQAVERMKQMNERLNAAAQPTPAPAPEPGAPPKVPAPAEPSPSAEPAPPLPETADAPAAAAPEPAPGPAAKAPAQAKPEAEKPPEEEPKPDGVATARQIAHVKGLIEAGSASEILSTYASITEPQVRRHIIDELIERLETFKIEPLLAIGALENDKQTFRYMIRQLLAANRSLVAKQIELDTYSPDLLQVAVAVLAELRLRSALPKLKQALDLEDPLVRCVAAHGIARVGQAAESQIPILTETARADPDPYVREAGAKALDSMHMIEAFDAFEDMARETKLDQAVLHVLDGMREEFDPDGSRAAQLAARAQKTDGAAPTTKGETKKPERIKPPVDPKIKAKRKKALIITVAVVIGVAAIGFYLYKKLPDILSMMKVAFPSSS